MELRRSHQSGSGVVPSITASARRCPSLSSRGVLLRRLAGSLPSWIQCRRCSIQYQRQGGLAIVIMGVGGCGELTRHEGRNNLTPCCLKLHLNLLPLHRAAC
ncbi:unnamed protein product [Urochloa humidicola]